MKRANYAAHGLNRFLHKWTATIFFVGFMLAQVMTVVHLSEYRTEVVKVSCESRRESREDLRLILMEVVNRLAGDEDREDLLLFIEENYPTLEC